MAKLKQYNLIDYSDKYTEYIQDKYDLNINENRKIIIPLIDINELNSFKWNIGLICGGSGSGKSTVLKTVFGEQIEPHYNDDKPIISQFESLEPEEVCSLFESVGLSSIPVWLRRPSELSVGEKARMDLCWIIINTPIDEPIIIDEFTSTVNRECAISMAYTLQRYIREHNRKVILSSCHFDIIESLSPDWIYNLNKQKDGFVELEHIMYGDSNYNTYNQVDNKDTLTKELKLI